MCDCHEPAGLLDRRSLLRAGAGVVTVAAVASAEPAAAGERRKTRKLVFKGEFRTQPEADWHYLPFRVPRGVSKISVSYEYQPTETEFGLTFNVIDIGIFDPSGRGIGNEQGFRGWSGGARSKFQISRSWATPGYLAGPLTPGKWHILLGPYLITGEGTPYRVVVRLHFGPRGERFEPTPAPQAVPGTGPGWYRGDLHTHTVHSDGRWTQAELVAAAQQAGLDFIGSSDHNTSAATYTWGKHVPDDFLVINGEEVTTRSGHWVAMGLPPKTWIDWRYRAEEDRFGQFSDRVHELGGMVIAAHPKNIVPSIRWDHGYDGVDALEVWNGPWTGTNNNPSALALWHQMLVDGTFVPAVGSSDSHHDGQPVGLPQTAYRVGSLSAAEVVAAAGAGHSWIVESSAVSVETFEAVLGSGAPVSCGDHLGATPGETATVRLVATGVPGSLARLIGPAGTLGFAVADETGRVEVEAQVVVGDAPLDFVRAEVGRPADDVTEPVEDTPIARMLALTNPVFLT